MPSTLAEAIAQIRTLLADPNLILGAAFLVIVLVISAAGAWALLSGYRTRR